MRRQDGGEEAALVLRWRKKGETKRRREWEDAGGRGGWRGSVEELLFLHIKAGLFGR